MRYLPPFVVHGAIHFRDEREIDTHAQAYRHLIEGLRDGLLDLDEIEKRERINEALQAPVT
jgi:hypothetical protein